VRRLSAQNIKDKVKVTGRQKPSKSDDAHIT